MEECLVAMPCKRKVQIILEGFLGPSFRERSPVQTAPERGHDFEITNGRDVKIRFRVAKGQFERGSLGCSKKHFHQG
jgi:hypothetical protein